MANQRHAQAVKLHYSIFLKARFQESGPNVTAPQ
jgi:hypothetical protein